MTKTSFSFAKAMTELEEINAWFEAEEIDLELGLEKFKRGQELLKKCKSYLAEMENEFLEVEQELEIET